MPSFAQARPPACSISTVRAESHSSSRSSAPSRVIRPKKPQSETSSSGRDQLNPPHEPLNGKKVEQSQSQGRSHGSIHRKESVPLTDNPPSNGANATTQSSRWVSNKFRAKSNSLPPARQPPRGLPSPKHVQSLSPTPSSWHQPQRQGPDPVNFPRVSPHIRVKTEHFLAGIRALGPGVGVDDLRVKDMVEFLVLEGPIELLADTVRELGERKETDLAEALFNGMEKRYGDEMDITAYNAIVYSLACVGRLEKAESIVSQLQVRSGRLSPTPFLAAVLLRQYVAHGQLSEAIALLEDMPQRLGLSPDLSHYRSILGSCATRDCNVLPSALTLIHRMKAQGIEPDQEVYESIIRLATNCKESGTCLRFLKEMEERNMASLRAYNLVMKSLAVRGVDVEARNILRRMEEHRVAPNAETYSWYISTMGRRGQTEYLEEVYQKIKDSPVLQEEAIIYNLLSAYGKSGNWERVEEVLRSTENSGCRQSKEVVKSLISAYGKARRFDDMEREFQGLKARDSRVTSGTYFRVMEAYCMGGPQHLPDVCRVILECEGKKVEMPKHMLSLLINALGKAGHFDVVKALLHEHLRYGGQLDTGVLQCLLSVYASAGRIEDVRGVLAFIKSKHSVIHTGYWAATIQFLEGGRLRDVVEIYEEMIAHQQKSNRLCSEVWTRTCARHGLLDQAVSTFLESTRIARGPPMEVLEPLLDACWWALEINTLRRVVTFDPSFLVPLGPNVFVTIIAAYAMTGDWKSAEQWFNSAKDLGVQLPLRAYTLLMEGYIHGCQVSKGESLAQSMAAMGHATTASNALIRLHGLSGDLEQMLGTYSTIVQSQGSEGVGDPGTYTALIQVCVANGKLSEALQVASQAERQFIMADPALLTALLAAFPMAVIRQRQLEVVEAARRLNLAESVCSLLEEAPSCSDASTGWNLDGLESYLQGFSREEGEGVYPELEREFVNNLVDSLWVQGKESLAAEVLILGVQRGLYPNLSSRKDKRDGSSVHTLSLRVLSVGSAQIVILIWLSVLQRQVRERADFSTSLFFIQMGFIELTLGGRVVRDAAEALLEDLGSPFGWSKERRRFLAEGERVTEWLSGIDVRRLLVVKNGRMESL